MERHPDEDELIALALGTLPGEPAEFLRHLATCPACRAAYDDLSATVDSVLPAAPAVAAPAGFDARVLDRLDLPAPYPVRRPRLRRLRGPRHPRPQRTPAAPGRPHRVRVPLLVAAAAAAGIGLGAVVGTTLADNGPAPAQVTAGAEGALLTTGSGATVGTVAPSYAGSAHVVVMQVTGGRPGAHYTCRLLLKDGTTREAGQWWMPSSGRATWIAYASADTIDHVQLITDDGHVWSSADLPG